MLERVIIFVSRFMNALFAVIKKDRPTVVDYGSNAYSFNGYNVVINKPKNLLQYLSEILVNTFAFVYIILITPLLPLNIDLSKVVTDTYNLFTFGLYMQSPIKPFKFACTSKEVFDIVLELPCIKMHTDDSGFMNIEYLHNVSLKNKCESQGIIIDCNKKLVKRHDSQIYSDDEFSLRIALITINTHLSLIHLRDHHYLLCIISAILLNNVKSESVARLLSPFISGSFAVPDFSTKVLTTNNGVLAQTVNNNNTQEIRDLINTFFDAYSFDDAFKNLMRVQETKDFFGLCKRFVQSFPEDGIDYDQVKQTMINMGYLKDKSVLNGHDILGYVLAAQTLGHYLMTGYFSCLHYSVQTLTSKDELSLSQYKYDISASTAFRATRITSFITDNFDYLFTDQSDQFLFKKFQRDVELFLFKMKLQSLPSHTNLPRCAYG